MGDTSPVMPVASSALHDEPLFRRMARLAERRLWRSGPIAELRKARYERRFESARGNVKMFRGIYDSYDAAQ